MINLHKLAGLKVLLIENDPYIRDTLRKALSDEGCVIESAYTCAEGIELLKEGPNDIIISDFNLPGINGYEFLKLANESDPESIKILVASIGDVDPMSRVFDCGIDDVIEKPFPFESLLYTLSKHLVDSSAIG